MKISFPDKSYIEVVKSPSPGKLFITILAIDKKNVNATIASTVELTEEQYRELIVI